MRHVLQQPSLQGRYPFGGGKSQEVGDREDLVEVGWTAEVKYSGIY